ncbi:MAG: hypothetical protein H8F28_23630, partial [Fibrella sp.]|nr:hypothetical protein [Armatimonadota bacterium]
MRKESHVTCAGWVRGCPIPPASVLLCLAPSLLGTLAVLSASKEALAQAPASVSREVQVPTSMRSAPFNVTRSLTVPPNFSVSVYARVPKARFLAITPDGRLLVSQPNPTGNGQGNIKLLRPNGANAPTVSDFATGLRLPHDMVFHRIGATTYLYIAESNRIRRCVYANGDLTARTLEDVVTGLPDSSRPELQGSHGHALKNIALTSDNKLYISSASASNDNPGVDQPLATTDFPTLPRAAVLQYNADGTGGRVYARGIRNAEGLDVLPGTSQVWLVSNNSDNLKYPYNDSTGWYGRVVTQYVDNHPPEYMTQIGDGNNLGWPFAYPNPDSGFDNMPLDPGYDHNRDWSQYAQSLFTSPTKGIQAHSAPLGFSFLQKTNFPGPYQQGAAVGLHGSWNRSQGTGYKVVHFPWNGTSGPGTQIDLVTGWQNGGVWGKPVDVAVDLQGDMFISDDHSGTIYKLTYTGQRVRNFTLINADTDQPIAGYDPIPHFATLNLATLPTRNLSIRVNTAPTPVGSVRFALDGNANYRVESAVPYAIAGDGSNGADYYPWTPGAGSHTLTATPYSAASGSGTPGAPLTLKFDVVDSTGIAEGTYRVTGNGFANGYCFDIYMSGGGLLTLGTWNAGNDQRFAVSALGSGQFRMNAVYNGQPLTARDEETVGVGEWTGS